MTAGSRRISANEEAPPLLFGGFPPPIKLLTAAFLLYSSSTSRLRLFLMNTQTPPAMAARATIPITTPAAMPALLGPEEDLADAVEEPVGLLDAVTTTVWPPIVTTDGALEVVAVAFPVALDAGADVDEDPVSDWAGEALVTS